MILHHDPCCAGSCLSSRRVTFNAPSIFMDRRLYFFKAIKIGGDSLFAPCTTLAL